MQSNAQYILLVTLPLEHQMMDVPAVVVLKKTKQNNKMQGKALPARDTLVLSLMK